MEIQICQTCGVILKGKSKNCSSCQVIISKFSPTTLPLVSRSSAPLAVDVATDPLVLERVVTHRQFSALYGVGFTGGNGGNGNGDGHADGNGGNGANGGNGGNGQATAPGTEDVDYGYGHPTLFGGASSMVGGFAGPSFGLNENYGGTTSFNDPVAPDPPPPSPMDPPLPQMPKLFDPAFNVQDEVNSFMSTAQSMESEVPTPDVSSETDFTSSDFLGTGPSGMIPSSSGTFLPDSPEPEPQEEVSAVSTSGTFSSSDTGGQKDASGSSQAPSNQAVPSSNLAAALGAAGAMGGLAAALGSSSGPTALGSFGYMPNLNQQPQSPDTPAAQAKSSESFFGDSPPSPPTNAPLIPSEARTAPLESTVSSGQFSTSSSSGSSSQPADFFGSQSSPAPPQDQRTNESESGSQGKSDFVPSGGPVDVPTPSAPSPSASSGDPDFDFFGGAPSGKSQSEEPNQSRSESKSPIALDNAGADEPKPDAQSPIASKDESNQKPVAGSDSAPPTSNPLTDFFGVSGGAPPIGGGEESSKPGQSGAKGDMDFFSNAPSSKAKAIDTDFEPPASKSKSGSSDDFFPDESRKRKTADDDERPKVAMHIKDANKSKATSSKLRDMESDDLDDDDDDEDKPRKKKTASPPRRSFSGGASKSASKKAKGKHRDDEDDESDEEDDDVKKKDDDDDDDDDKPGFLSALDGDVTMMGMTLNKKAALTLCAIVLIVLVQIPGWIGGLSQLAGSGSGGTADNSTPGGGFNIFSLINSGPPADLPQVSGDWQVIGRATLDGKTFNFAGSMRMAQNNSEIGGQGQDQGGAYLFKGTIREGNKVTFVKQYMANGQAQGKAITYDGMFDTKKQPLEAGGLFQTQIATGHFIHRKVQTVTGQWKARMTQQLASSNTPVSPNINTPGSIGISGSSVDSVKGPQKFFMWIAGGMIAVGVFIFMFFLYLFGPAGKMNYWEKQKYIPSQFKGQHNKMVSEMSKPLKAGGLPLGKREEWAPIFFWTPKNLAIPPDMRRNNPHILVIGAGDKGKTRLVASMVCHDIESADRAVIVIDSDGSLTDIVTRWMAAHSKGKEFAKRVVLIDPTYKGGSFAYNPLEMPDDGDLQAAASAIVYGFKAIYTEPPGSQSQWNPQTANILRNAALLLIANNKTLTDLPTLLQDNDFRDILLEGVEKKKSEKIEYISLLETWGQYKKLARTDQWITWVEPILNRVTPMLSDPRIRPILTKPVGDLKLKKVVEDRRVLLVKIPQGQLDQNANLLGSLIVTGLKQAALSLGGSSNKQRPVALYMDEFDNFIEKETLENITSETKKFQIGFVGAIKTLQHLPEDFRNQLIINVGIMTVFALAKKDGDMLGPQMFRVDGRKIKHQTISNFFNKVNTSPQFELISDEEKLNIDRVVGQEERTFFCYRVGTVAGVFHMKSPDFNDVPDKNVKWKLIDKMHGVGSSEDADGVTHKDDRKKKRVDDDDD